MCRLRLCLAFLATMRPALDPASHQSLELGLLVSPLLRGPARHRPFAPTLHLHQRKSRRNLHLQYLDKSPSTPHCQSLIKARGDHPPVFGCSGPHCCTSLFSSSVLALRINQGTQWFSGEPLETLQTRCSLRQSSLMTRLPRSPG
jgi:hypothetical protein